MYCLRNWELFNENECWISAEHVPGSHNTVADFVSRAFNENTGWKLSPFLFQIILQRFQFIANIDLFATLKLCLMAPRPRIGSHGGQN